MFTLDSNCDEEFRYTASQLHDAMNNQEEITLVFQTRSKTDNPGIKGRISALAEPRDHELSERGLERPQPGEPWPLIWVRVRSSTDRNRVVEGLIEIEAWKGSLKLDNVHGRKELRVPRALHSGIAGL